MPMVRRIAAAVMPAGIAITIASLVLLLAVPASAQKKRLRILTPSGELTEYDLTTFTEKQKIKAPADVSASPQNLQANESGEMLFAPSASLPLDESDVGAGDKIWLFDGHSAASLPRHVERSTATTGSNLAITETAPTPYLAADGLHLYWFAAQARRLQRDGVDLSTKNTWLAWRTDLSGSAREELASGTFPDCPCPTGGCEETCPYPQVWAPDQGIRNFFIFTQIVTGKDQSTYKSTSIYTQDGGGKWTGAALDSPFYRILDAADASTILEAVPDTGCCGWANQSDDQTILHSAGKAITIFDERSQYRNPDYDVSFYTETGKLSPDLSAVALTIAATAVPNKPIQLAQQGQADPTESERIRKSLLDLPAVEIMSLDTKSGEAPRRMDFLPHAALVGWITDKEILLVEEHALVVYNVASKSRRKTSIRVEDAEHVFLR